MNLSEELKWCRVAGRLCSRVKVVGWFIWQSVHHLLGEWLIFYSSFGGHRRHSSGRRFCPPLSSYSRATARLGYLFMTGKIAEFSKKLLDFDSNTAGHSTHDDFFPCRQEEQFVITILFKKQNKTKKPCGNKLLSMMFFCSDNSYAQRNNNNSIRQQTCYC